MTAEMLTRCGIGKVIYVFFFYLIIADGLVFFIKSLIQFPSVGFAQINVL